MVTGTIRNTVKLQVLNNEWQQKKKELENGKKRSEMTETERMLADLNERAEAERESNRHADTYNKLKSGGKLTASEIEYLEKNDPEALRRYREDQAEKAAYERALKNCKSKEEVERLKTFKLGELASEAKDITNNPYIPKDKKLELMNQMNNKLCLQQEAYYKYLESEQYQKLPEENEESEKADKLNDIEDDTENNTDIKIDIKKDLEDTKKHIELNIGNGSEDFERLSAQLRRAASEFNEDKSRIDIQL